MVVRLGGVSAEQNIARIVHGRNLHAGGAQQFVGVSARCAKHGIEHDFQSRLAHCIQIDCLPQPRQIIRLGIE